MERFFAEVAQTDDIQSFVFERFVSPGQKGSAGRNQMAEHSHMFAGLDELAWIAACLVIGGRPRMLQFGAAES
ncbi:hypothetical protein AWV79_32125 [Cupriavidus sp. UYMMa02A]|nr:hypothetical protein AWV79_32125 [Cupriavidus sp. UYMMa02A]